MPKASRTPELDCRGRVLPLGGRTHIVGILNATPDSFYDGGRWADPAAAAGQAARLAAEGAAAIDLGGQSTRPGHREISAAEEIARVVPVLERIVTALELPISIDTYKPEVARAALAAGAHWLNDVHGLQGEPAMAEVAAEFGCPVVIMHYDRRFADDVGEPIGRLLGYFERSLAIAAGAGVPAERLVLDPGMGFFKTPAQQLAILRRIGELKTLGCPVLVGVSRKSLIGHVLGGGDPADRLEGTLAVTALAVQQGIDFIRVHDVAANVRAARMAEAIVYAP